MTQLNWSTSIMLPLFAATSIVASAQTFTTLANFNGANGSRPISLVQGTDGNFYGAAIGGGANGLGTIFQVTPTGALTTVHSFAPAEGSGPGPLVLATNGNFFGTANQGGNNACLAYGCGTVFTATPAGALTVMHTFNGPEGAAPGVLMQASNGTFYGATAQGGGGGVNTLNGTVYQMTPSGTVATLANFNGANGSRPSGLVVSGSGNIYGVTISGGTDNAGTIFAVTPAGGLVTLYSFSQAYGTGPTTLILGADGALYGTTSVGGNNNAGTIFKFTSSGTLKTLYSFGPGARFNVACPCGLIQGSDGNFYGNTTHGGVNGTGALFELTPAGKLTVLYSFPPPAATDSTYAQMIQGTDGNFYGTTQNTGSTNTGSVFMLSTGLAPFVNTVPNSGRVGTSIRILGTNLTGATGVTFNGTPASYSVASGSQIFATVPSGAASGKIQVTTPGGTLTSGVAFRVQP